MLSRSVYDFNNPPNKHPAHPACLLEVPNSKRDWEGQFSLSPDLLGAQDGYEIQFCTVRHKGHLRGFLWELGFPCGSAGKESACNARDLGSIRGLGRSPGEGKDYPLQYSGLENSTVCIVRGVTKIQTWLSDFHSHFLRPIFSPSRRRNRNKFSFSWCPSCWGTLSHKVGKLAPAAATLWPRQEVPGLFEDGEIARWREAMLLRPPVRSWASPETAYLWLVLISNRRATLIKLNYSSLLFKYLVPWTQWRITNWYTSIPTTSWDEDSGWCIIWLQP